MERAWKDNGCGPVRTEPKLSWPLDRHRIDFAAKLGGGKLSELTGKVLTDADHEVFLTSFQFVLVTLQED